MKQILVFLMCAVLPLFAIDATIEIIKGVGSNLNIAVESKDAVRSDLDQKVGKMIEADLKVAGFYNVVQPPQGASPSEPYTSAVYVNSNLHQLVRYSVYNDNKEVGIDAQVYDIRGKRQLWSQKYKVPSEDRYVFLAHYLVRDLSHKMGVNMEWIARNVLLSRQVGQKSTEIMIADYSLTYRLAVVKGGFNVFPKWANADQSAYYYTQYQGKPTLYRVERYTGKKTKIIESEGMLVCSDVSKDGNKLLLTMAPDDQPDIYEYDVRSRKLTQLTNNRGIDVNGRYIDGENAFVFVSDRHGYPEIFYAKIGDPNSAIQFIFKGRNNSYIATWKDYAVFVSRDTDSEFAENTFNLYLVSTKSDYIRQLTTTGKNNFPRFSTSGDTILHTKEIRRGKESALAIIRLPYNKSFLFPLSGSIQAIDW
ncbi:MAG: Tol-Pal system protein TolB [Helicobacteraceae bacterium]|jgi:TolB protein|nr:Tol-Pal system protein TolB [Helicobacteraceae bacterium]